METFDFTEFDFEICPACDHVNAGDAIRCRACGWVLVTFSEGLRRIAAKHEGANE